MMFLIYVILTIFVAYYIYRILYYKPKKLHGIYNEKGVWLLYWCRWAFRVVEVWAEQVSRTPRLNNFDLSFSSYDTCGIEATPSEKELEKPKPLITDRHEDSLLMFGVDREGRAVVARVVRLTQRRAYISLCVVDNTGTVYTLPYQPDSNLINIKDEGWRCGGLALTCVEPMRCWRLKFNGLLRKGAREEYITEEKDDSDDEGIIHVRLDFLWHSMRAPVDVWTDSSPRLLAHALANEPRASVKTFTCLEHDEYEQWGSLHGTVNFGGTGDRDPEEWYLRGCRKHRWGLSESVANFHRSVDIFTYFRNGDVCSLQACSYTTGLSHYVMGYMQEASGTYRPILTTDISLPDLAEDGVLPTNIFTKFTTWSRDYDLWQKIGPGMTYYTGDPWTLQHKLNVNYAASRHAHGWGITIFSDRFKGLCPVPERQSVPAVTIPRVEIEDTTPLVVNLSDYLCRSPALAGGKGASLAVLTLLRDVADEEFTVPTGVVVTVAAWLQQLRSSSEMQSAVKAIEQAAGSSQPQQLRDACARAVQTVQKSVLCAEVKDAIKAAVEEAFEGAIETYRFAVRSSGCSEDGEETSAAGQNQTLLGVCGQECMLEAVLACWASQFTYQSVEYRRQRGQGVDVGMAVVIEEMVAAETAGVLFTRDPVSGSPATITITANYGLGESVVSAMAEPDTVTVKRSWRDSLSVATRVLGAKKTKCVMQAGGGTAEVEVPLGESEQVCLSDKVALRLARIALLLEQTYGSPRDVEFAVSKDIVYLLQARPITSLDAWTDFELIHEKDSAILTDHELLTRANTGEVLPGSTTPLSLSILLPGLDLAFQKEITASTFPRGTTEPHHVKLCSSYSSQVFLNMIEMQYRSNEKHEVTLINRTMDLAIYGHPVTENRFVKWGTERFGILGVSAYLSLLQLIGDKLFNNRKLRKDRERYGNYEVDRERRVLSAASLYSEITRRLTDLMNVSHTHQCTSRFSAATQAIALVILADGKLDLSEENQLDIASILKSCSAMDSVDVPTDLKAVARVIGENEEMEEFLAMTPDEGQVWLGSHPGAVGDVFRSFLSKHGHRCVGELDLGSVSWGIDPRGLVQNLQVMVRHPESYVTEKKEAPVTDTIDNLKSEVSDKTKKALRFLLPICREAVANREASKSLITKTIDGFRKAYRNLSQLMVGEGRMPDPDLIFFLTHPEIGQLLTLPSPSILSKAIRRKRLYAQLDALKFPEISIGIPRPINVTRTGDEGTSGSTQVLSGTPVWHGVITAKARVITNLQDAPSIQNGEILVTHSTDVGWTPYFPLLSGVVTEIGGLISHGAVVAREYGLPCVVGVIGATMVLESGDVIELNGNKGFVKKLCTSDTKCN